MRQALALSDKGRDPKTFMPWQEQKTRPFADFQRSYPFFFRKKKG